MVDATYFEGKERKTQGKSAPTVFYDPFDDRMKPSFDDLLMSMQQIAPEQASDRKTKQSF